MNEGTLISDIKTTLMRDAWDEYPWYAMRWKPATGARWRRFSMLEDAYTFLIEGYTGEREAKR